MSKKKYKNAAEKQKAYRLRHGQKRKVPLEIRRGEKLGAQETDLRAKRDNESWDEYHIYIEKVIAKARQKQARAVVTQDKEITPGASRGGTEPVMGEDYYEIREAHEASLKKLGKRGRIKKK
jgi:hypothetical protein